MVANIVAILLASLAASTATGTPQATQKQEPIYNIAADDPEMNAAIAQGRTTLPNFYRRLASPHSDDSQFMVKFDIDTGEGVEFVWATALDRSHTPMTGILINQPVQTADRVGDRVPILEAHVIDWGYRSRNVMQGSFTNRVLIERMPAAEAASYRAYLGW